MSARDVFRRLRIAIGNASVRLPLPGGDVTITLGVESGTERPEPRIKSGKIEVDPRSIGPRAMPPSTRRTRP